MQQPAEQRAEPQILAFLKFADLIRNAQVYSSITDLGSAVAVLLTAVIEIVQ